MPPETLYALVLAAAIAHATWNALLKSSPDPMLMLAAIRAVGLLLGLSLLPFVELPAPLRAFVNFIGRRRRRSGLGLSPAPSRITPITPCYCGATATAT